MATKRIEHIKIRLEHWQQWYFSPGGKSTRSVYVERVDCSQHFGFVGPEINEEAIVTDQAVAALPKPLNKTLRFVYLDNVGNSMEGHARRLAITRDALHKRLCHADLRIDIWLEARTAAHLMRAQAYQRAA